MFATAADNGQREGSAYRLCGLAVTTAIPLTAFLASERPSGSVDVKISVEDGIISSRPSEVRVKYGNDISTLEVGGLARFEIVGGTEIRVTRNPGTSEKDLEIVLYGPAWAILLHQRKLLPLHASVVETESGLVGFMGPSGAGKSTVAASLQQAGFPLVCDDVVAIEMSSNGLLGAWPFLSRLKLRVDAVVALGLKGIEPVSDRLDREKVFVAPRYRSKDEWLPLRCLYKLEFDTRTPVPTIERLSLMQAVTAIVDNTYQFPFVSETRGLGDHLRSSTNVAATVPVFRLTRPAFSHHEASTAALVHHLRSTIVGLLAAQMSPNANG